MTREPCLSRDQCPCAHVAPLVAPAANADLAALPHSARLTLARLVRAWLRESGEPLKAVSSRLGVCKSTISQWAHQTRFPKPEELDMLATCIGVPTACLFCDRLAEGFEHDADRHAAEASARGRAQAVPPRVCPKIPRRRK